MDFHIRRARGELLFGDVWLLGEGESEYWILTGAAEGLDLDLERAGVRIVDGFAQAGAAALVKVADDLGIAWHCLADGDAAGQRTVRSLSPLLKERDAEEHITLLPFTCIEHLLCEEGFGDVYENALQKSERDGLTPLGDPQHWKEVAGKVKGKRKVPLAVEVAEMLGRKEKAVPQALQNVLQAALKLAPG